MPFLEKGGLVCGLMGGLSGVYLLLGRFPGTLCDDRLKIANISDLANNGLTSYVKMGKISQLVIGGGFISG